MQHLTNENKKALSLIDRIISKIPNLNYETFKARQLEIVERMKFIAEKIKAIDKKSGEEILSYLSSISLNAIGVPISIPPKFGYIAAGFPLGIILLEIKIRKLKPYYSELKTLNEQFIANVELLKIYEQASFSIPNLEIPEKPLTAENKEETESYKAEQEKAAELAKPKVLDNIGLGELQRSAGISDNGVYFFLALLLIGFIYWLKNRKTKKRK